MTGPIRECYLTKRTMFTLVAEAVLILAVVATVIVLTS